MPKAEKYSQGQYQRKVEDAVNYRTTYCKSHIQQRPCTCGHNHEQTGAYVSRCMFAHAGELRAKHPASHLIAKLVIVIVEPIAHMPQGLHDLITTLVEVCKLSSKEVIEYELAQSLRETPEALALRRAKMLKRSAMLGPAMMCLPVNTHMPYVHQTGRTYSHA